jgi:hypothetical protein
MILSFHWHFDTKKNERTTTRTTRKPTTKQDHRKQPARHQSTTMDIAIDSTTDDHTNDADSLHPFKVFKNKEYEENDEGRLELCIQHLRLLSSRDRCKNHTNSKKKTMGCNCLGFLDNEFYWEATGNWMVDFGKMNRQDQQRVIIEKIRHADSLAEGFGVASQDPKKNILYNLPFIMPEEADDDDDGATRILALQALNHHKICKSALMELIFARKKWWGTCREHLRSGTVPVHGLKGRPSNRKRKFREEEEAHLIEFFVEVKEFAEPSATRFVLEKTGESSTRNDDTELEYLPPSLSRMKLYQRYASTRGWNANTNNIGIIEPSPRVGEPQLHLCSWPSFFYYWKKNFPKLRVRKPIEDICSMCYIFQNTHKYSKRKSTTPPPHNSENQNSDNSNNPQAENESDDDDDDDDSIIPFLVDRSRSIGETIDDGANEDEDVVVDPDVVADVDQDTIEREAKILRAAKHVVMARAQRKLFQQEMKQAREDSASSKDTSDDVIQQSQKSHVFVGDYCQKLELPSFCSQQPGDTYYLSPLTVNCFGAVDCSNEKDHLYAYVYHEGEGKCGGNNVASLVLETLRKTGLLNLNNPPSKKLTFVFDNCSGQNKNGMVLKLVVYLVEMGYFEEVQFMFLIVGHTKNPADRLFNLLKLLYRSLNLFTMKQLIATVNTNEFVTAVQAEEEVFKDFMEYQQRFYKAFESNTIKIYHVFSSHMDKKGDLRYYESDLIRQEETADLKVAESLMAQGPLDKNDTNRLDQILNKLEETRKKTTQHLMKRGTYGPNRKEEMQAATMKTLTPPSVRDIKQVEMTKFKKFVPEIDQADPIYRTPDESVIKTIKDQKNQKVRERANKNKKAKIIASKEGVVDSK